MEYQENLLLFVDAFLIWENPQSRLLLGLILSTAIMTVLKSDYTGDVFSKIPKQYMSFVPLVLGTILGAVNGFFFPIYGIIQDALLGGALIGSGQITGYQTIKGFKIADLITLYLKTMIKIPEKIKEETK